MATARLGLALALFGALVLTPDALFLRLSGMDGAQMLGWRGLCMGTLFLGAWALFARKPGDPARLLSGTGLTVVTCQYFNATLFPLGIATAPVAPVLLGVATAPVWSALLARTLHGEVASRATWTAIALVLLGIAIAISGKDAATIDRSALLGALCGLGVALPLAVNFVPLRFSPDLPLLLAIGCGAALAGLRQGEEPDRLQAPPAQVHLRGHSKDRDTGGARGPPSPVHDRK